MDAACSWKKMASGGQRIRCCKAEVRQPVTNKRSRCWGKVVTLHVSSTFQVTEYLGTTRGAPLETLETGPRLTPDALEQQLLILLVRHAVQDSQNHGEGFGVERQQATDILEAKHPGSSVLDVAEDGEDAGATHVLQAPVTCWLALAIPLARKASEEQVAAHCHPVFEKNIAKDVVVGMHARGKLAQARIVLAAEGCSEAPPQAIQTPELSAQARAHGADQNSVLARAYLVRSLRQWVLLNVPQDGFSSRHILHDRLSWDLLQCRPLLDLALPNLLGGTTTGSLHRHLVRNIIVPIHIQHGMRSESSSLLQALTNAPGQR